jgi:hypothetical protein
VKKSEIQEIEKLIEMAISSKAKTLKTLKSRKNPDLTMINIIGYVDGQIVALQACQYALKGDQTILKIFSR